MSRLYKGVLVGGGGVVMTLTNLTAVGVANAEPPPNCTVADIAGVAGGVNFAMSAYLFTHADVNAELSSLEGLPEEQTVERARAYLEAHPQVAAELRGIRAPLTELRARCNVSLPMQHDVLG